MIQRATSDLSNGTEQLESSWLMVALRTGSSSDYRPRGVSITDTGIYELRARASVYLLPLSLSVTFLRSVFEK